MLLPEIKKRVLAWVENEEYPFVGYYDDDDQWKMETSYLNYDNHRNDIFGEVIAWQELPTCQPIDVGDYVLHTPSQEKWVCAGVHNERLYWFGFPFGGSAELSDCKLIKKATNGERNKILQELAAMNSLIR